jgi:hypothetical protein
VDSYGFPWIPMDFYGFLWILMDSYGFSMDSVEGINIRCVQGAYYVHLLYFIGAYRFYVGAYRVYVLCTLVCRCSCLRRMVAVGMCPMRNCYMWIS